MKNELKLLIIIVAAFLAGYLVEEIIDGYGVSRSVENTVEIFSELFSVFVAFSIFAITWHAYTESKDNHSLFLGAAFLITGLLILFHALSYPFMPEFITPNSSHKAAIFMTESRLILALWLLASVYIYKNTLPGLINKRVLISFIIILSAISLYSILNYHDSILSGYDPDNGIPTDTLLLLSTIAALILCAGYLYAKRVRETGQKNLTFLIYGSVIIAFSTLVYFSYEFSGHFLIIAGFFYIYLGLYKSSIKLPYEKLALAEEKLRQAAEEKYRNLFDNANDAIITTDPEDRITDWNISAEKIFGWKGREVMGKDLSQLIVPSDLLAKKEKIIRDALAGRSISGIETVRLRSDGTKIDVSMTTSPLLDANQNITGLSIILRDITEHKRTEEILLKLSSAVQQTADLVVITDKEGIIEYVNPAFEKITGYSKGEAIGKTPRILKSGKQNKDLYEHLWKMILSGEVFHEVLINKKKNGELYYSEKTITPIKDASGKIGHFVSTDKDITEHKLAEGKIRGEKEFTGNLIKGLKEGFVVVDREGKQILVNDEMCKMTGYDEKELLDQNPPFKYWAEEGLRDTKGAFEKTLKGIEDEYELIFRKKNGERFTAQVTPRKTIDPEGNVIFFATIKDITKLKKAEEIRLQNQGLLLASKAKSEFLATMSHELRTPLNSVIGFSELLKQGGPGALNEKQGHYANNILTSGKHLLSLIDDILDISKVEAGKMDIFIEKMPVPETINETLELIKERASKHNVILEKGFDPELDFIEADRQKFKQIFFNLLSNAAKFSKSDGGKITITTKKEGDKARFSVSDTGIGIKEEDMGKLFKTFEQLDSGISRSYGGTGLGLAISKKLVELHGGEIWAESKYGEGSAFTFLLPIKAKLNEKNQLDHPAEKDEDHI